MMTRAHLLLASPMVIALGCSAPAPKQSSSGPSSTASTASASASSGSSTGGAGGAGGAPASSTATASSTSSGSSTGSGGSTGASPLVPGCPLFAPSDPYNQPVDALPLDPNSGSYVAYLSKPDGGADFGACTNFGGYNLSWGDLYYFNVVGPTQPDVPVKITDGYSQLTGFSPDGGGYSKDFPASLPIPPNALVEDPGAKATSGDRHLMVGQTGTCLLYELYAAHEDPDGGWSAYNAFRWDLKLAEQLPDGVGSTTAAGTHLTPGVLWVSEVMAGAIEHAIDLVGPVMTTAQQTYVHPATGGARQCDDPTSPNAFPYGGRLRLRASYPETGLGPQAKVIVTAMKKYGVIYTDLACCYGLRVEHSAAWNAADVKQIEAITMGDFEVPQLGTIHSSGSKCASTGCQ